MGHEQPALKYKTTISSTYQTIFGPITNTSPSSSLKQQKSPTGLKNNNYTPFITISYFFKGGICKKLNKSQEI